MTNKLGQEFIDVNRNLAWANTPDEWIPATEEMQQFLNDLETTIKTASVEESWGHQEQAQVFSILLTVLAEAGQYRHESFVPNPESETDLARRQMINTDYIPLMGEVRQHAVKVVKTYFEQPAFETVIEYIKNEIFPLLDEMSWQTAPDRFMPFRVIQVGNIIERLSGFRSRTGDPRLVGDKGSSGLLDSIYQFKYLRFGTSGVRGRWQRDFTETRAKQIVQGICDYLKNEEVPSYLKGEDLRGKRIVIGYDSRLNAPQVAEWAAQVCLANGFEVMLAFRDTPTPALVYYLGDYLPEDSVAGLINCTASHNPPEWQGIKFNPRQGWPAPTNITDFIAARINEIQLINRPVHEADIKKATEQGQLEGFDPIDKYIHWILDSGNGNERISIDKERIRKFFAGKKVVVDEMHGAGRGYLTRALGEIGVSYTVIHAERNPYIPTLDYANPEEPFINQLKDKVQETGAALGLAMDTDADRFGVVDKGGTYFRPNQILPMLLRYLGLDRGLKGRVIATQTGSPLLEIIASKMSGNEAFKPDDNIIPAYVDHPFYKRRVGNREDRVYRHTFMVPVGIKYIEEQRRTDGRYKMMSPLPENWRDVILIGGEESSGLTTKGHVTDKDGIWANLLIMDMLAYYGSRPDVPVDSIAALWQDTTELAGTWVSYGGRESDGSNSGRSDVDSVLEAKERVINYYLDIYGEGKENSFAGLEVIYAGGVRYDLVELQLRQPGGDDRHFLRMRASGTEPINRIYVESSDSEIAQALMKTVLKKLEEFTISEIQNAHSEWRLADILAFTTFSPAILKTVNNVLATKDGWSVANLVSKLQALLQTNDYLEGRNRKMVIKWVESLDI
jgi:phosphomannomutase